MKRIILLNGPPRCGKDTAAELLLAHLPFPVAHVKFAEPLRQAIPAMFGLGKGTWMRLYQHDKDVPSRLLKGMSPRQAMIWLSEDVMKPTFGYDIFGHLAINQIEDATKEPQNNIVLSDSGFTRETRCLIDRYGIENLLLLQMYRDGCTFANDSREYIDIEGLNTSHIFNNGSLNDLKNTLVPTVCAWVNTLNPLPETPMEAIQVTLYRTADGATFNEREEAQAHQALLDADPLISIFVAEYAPDSERAQSRVRNLLKAFTVWKSAQQQAA